MSYYLRRLLDIVTAPLRMLLSTPSRLLSGSRRLLGLSLPARLAILVAIFLVICVVTVLVIFMFHTPSRAFLQAKLNWKFWVGIPALVVAIPIVLYKALKLWLEGDVSPFPDIDHAFRAGLAELERGGLDLAEVPLFLILGSADEDHEKAVFAASGLNFNVRAVPQGPAALHWYAHGEGVYLACTDAGGLGRLAGMAKTAAQDETPVPRPIGSESSVAPIRGTIVAGSGGFQSGAASGPIPPEADQSEADQSGFSAGGDIRGTMVAGSDMSAAGGDFVASAEKRVIKLQKDDAAEQQRRLEYVCRLIRRARQPLCPINGILTMLPFGLIQESVPEAIEVQRAVKSDLATVAHGLKVRCPVTAMVVGLEEEAGFRELVRRVGRQRATGQRFGKGFALWNPPTPQRLEALAAHACGSFEDWVYALFREKDALSKPGNTKLYALLCKIRRNVQSRLTNILVAGYATEKTADGPSESLRFGGCYFAATGETQDRQAFVKGVFEKLPQQQEDLQWTDEAYREDDKYQLLAQGGFAVDTVMLLGLVGLIVNRWFPFWK